MTVHDRLSKLEDIQYNIDHYEKRLSDQMPAIYNQLSKWIVDKWNHDREIQLKSLAYWKRRYNREQKQLEYYPDLFDPKHLDNIWIDDIDFKDAPDFVDAYISQAYYYGTKLTEQQLDTLNEDSDYVYDCLQTQLY